MKHSNKVGSTSVSTAFRGVTIVWIWRAGKSALHCSRHVLNLVHWNLRFIC